MKVCMGCKREKPLDCFWPDRRKKHGRMARCKDCKSAAVRAYRESHPDMNRKRYWANRDAERERHLVRKYGITLAVYATMLAAQLGKCAICGKPEPKHKTLDVDHDHETGRVRGLLCTSCNRVLGHAHDSVERLQAAVEYLLASRKSPRLS